MNGNHLLAAALCFVVSWPAGIWARVCFEKMRDMLAGRGEHVEWIGPSRMYALSPALCFQCLAGFVISAGLLVATAVLLLLGIFSG